MARYKFYIVLYCIVLYQRQITDERDRYTNTLFDSCDLDFYRMTSIYKYDRDISKTYSYDLRALGGGGHASVNTNSTDLYMRY